MKSRFNALKEQFGGPKEVIAGILFLAFFLIVLSIVYWKIVLGVVAVCFLLWGWYGDYTSRRIQQRTNETICNNKSLALEMVEVLAYFSEHLGIMKPRNVFDLEPQSYTVKGLNFMIFRPYKKNHKEIPVEDLRAMQELVQKELNRRYNQGDSHSFCRMYVDGVYDNENFLSVKVLLVDSDIAHSYASQRYAQIQRTPRPNMEDPTDDDV